jgi:hypothetical protein
MIHFFHVPDFVLEITLGVFYELPTTLSRYETAATQPILES